MFGFLETDVREQQKYEKRIQTIVDNTVNDLVVKWSLKIVWKTKITFLLRERILYFFDKKYFLFLETYFFKIPKNLIASAFFLVRQILENIDMPQQKSWYLLTAKANFECLHTIYIQNTHI